MTQQPPSQSTAAPSPHEATHFVPETFWGSAYRRTRYVAAIVLSAVAFTTIGWQVAAPRPWAAGVSLLVWNNGFVAVLVLAALLLAVTAIASLLVHPDSPHMGLFCALVGMAGLAIRGGSTHFLMAYAQTSHAQHVSVCISLAAESLLYAMMFLVAELFARQFHDRFLANIHWIHRLGMDLSPGLIAGTREGRTALGVAHTVSETLKTRTLHRLAAVPLAMICSGIITVILLAVLLQSQQKGQVLMACGVASFVATMLTYLAFPTVPALATLIVPPLAGAAGFAYNATLWLLPAPGAPLPHDVYPGHAFFFMMRGLPIDYLTAGGAGAILGYYAGFRWAMTSHEE